MKNFKLFSMMVLSLAMGSASLTQAAEVKSERANCYLGACVGDRAINVSRDYRVVTIYTIDNVGKFVLYFEDTGRTGGGWDREDLALMSGCSGDLCVGFPAINVTRNYRAVNVAAIQSNGKYVLKFADTAGYGGNWDRFDLAVAWGCSANLCVNDTVYNRINNRTVTIAAIQTMANGSEQRFVLDYGTSGLGGNWEYNDLTLIRRGPVAYPPVPYPVPNPTQCPPGTYYDTQSGRCLPMPYPQPTPVPYCPPGTHYDRNIGRCVANAPAPVPTPQPRLWVCSMQQLGRIYEGRGPTRALATEATLRSCTMGSGGVCQASNVSCRQ